MLAVVAHLLELVQQLRNGCSGGGCSSCSIAFLMSELIQQLLACSIQMQSSSTSDPLQQWQYIRPAVAVHQQRSQQKRSGICQCILALQQSL